MQKTDKSSDKQKQRNKIVGNKVKVSPLTIVTMLSYEKICFITFRNLENMLLIQSPDFGLVLAQAIITE